MMGFSGCRSQCGYGSPRITRKGKGETHVEIIFESRCDFANDYFRYADCHDTGGRDGKNGYSEKEESEKKPLRQRAMHEGSAGKVR
jgi:hypothetical protein